ncbi:MAG: DUF1592 domain-containing protein [Verrucomicrobiaceae bacterium]|nr:DUF1592 domain-containing protein [Verrucomicrobiaceae bacterium]
MRLILAPCILCLSTAGFSSGLDSAAAARGEAEFKNKVEPLLEKYCFDCHSDGVEKGDFAFDEHKTFADLRADMVLWDHARHMLATHVMPPEKKPRPTLAERDAILAWIDDAVFWFDPAKIDPGHVTARRLNRTEYNNTIRDCLLVDLRPADEFPPDDTGYGFDNIGDVLTLSPMLMEKYMRAARQVADAAITVKPPEHAHLLLGPAKFWNQKGKTSEWSGSRWFNNNAEIAAKVTVPAEGTYKITLRVAATQAGSEPAKLQAHLGNEDLGTHEVTTVYRGDKGPWQSITREVKLPKGDSKLTVAFINDFADDKNPDPNKRDRNLALDEVAVDGPFGLSTPRPSRFLGWLLDGRPVGAPGLDLTGEDFEKGEGVSQIDTGTITLATSGYVRHALELAAPGQFGFRMKVGSIQAGNEPAKFELRIGGKTIGAFSVTAKDQAPQWFECKAALPAGRHEMQIWFLNDFYDPKTKADRNLWVHELHVRQGDAKDALSAAEMPALIERMTARLFRRPATAEEKTRWSALAAAALKEDAGPLETLEIVLEGMLVSPSFLFRGEPRTAGAASNGSALIDEYSLASRLSYFLWAAPPDDRLLQLAAKNELRKNLVAEVRRMIGDWRAYSMAENFAGQWLQLRDMDVVTPSEKRFPDFKSGVAYSMKKETQNFFDYILHENRSVIEFLNADYTFLNSTLARYYGLDGPKGGDRSKFEKVSLKGTPRGGVMTQGSILTLTSNPTRTSPVKRGKFMLENILGTPPPPAPGGVPPLDDRKIDFGRLTLRQQMEEHRTNASCAGCHAFLDPMGLAFENYDAVGRWRDTDKGNPIDAGGELVRGQKFGNFVELRELLVREMSGDFERNLAESLLTYALGRGLEHFDKPAVREIVSRTKVAQHRFQDMIIAVCESVPFQKMRAAAVK